MLEDKKMSGKMKIKFANGNESNFDYESQAEPAMFAKRLRESLNSNALVIQMNEGIEVIPMANIESLTIIPSRMHSQGKVVLQGAFIAERSS